MADRPIQVGDLVMVVRARSCCGAKDAIGLMFRVEDIGHHDGFCLICGQSVSGTVAYLADGKKGDITRLKRLDPDALKDETPTREEIEA